MKKGFTLSELLMALTIVGVIAVLTVPVMMNNIHNKMFATQVKNMSAMIEQLAQDQLLVHRTRDLSDTDFADPEELLSDKHFAITKTCSASTALKDCWKTAAEGKDKVTYKNISNGGTPVIYSNKKTVILKNGVIMSIFPNTAANDGYVAVEIDINGNDKPNMAGRDLFAFYIDPKGHVVSLNSRENMNLENSIQKCNKAQDVFTPWYCYGALVDSGWKMDY